MPLVNRFIPYDCSIQCVALASAFLRQLQSYSPDFGAEVAEESNPNSLVRDSLYLRAVNPKIALPTTDLSFLSNLPGGFLNIVPDSTHPGFLAYGRNVPDGAVPDAVATTSHIKCQVSDGLLFAQSLRASHNQKAVLSLMLLARLGTVATYSINPPMAFTTGVALRDAGTGTPKEYTLGPITYNSGATVLTGVEDMNVNFGLQVTPEGDAGNPYPRFIGIFSTRARYEFTTADMAFANVVGQSLVVTGFVAYFRKCKQGSDRELNNAGTHVSFTHAAGTIVPGAVSLKNKSTDALAFTFYPSDAPTISTTDSIPAGA